MRKKRPPNILLIGVDSRWTDDASTKTARRYKRERYKRERETEPCKLYF